jgi:hypothetical protein
MAAGIKFVHRADEHKLAFIEQRDLIRDLFRAIGDVMRHHHLRHAQLSLHFAD